MTFLDDILSVFLFTRTTPQYYCVSYDMCSDVLSCIGLILSTNKRGQINFSLFGNEMNLVKNICYLIHVERHKLQTNKTTPVSVIFRQFGRYFGLFNIAVKTIAIPSQRQRTSSLTIANENFRRKDNRKLPQQS